MGGRTGYHGRVTMTPARQNAPRPTYSHCRYVTYRDGDAVECGAEKETNYSPYCERCFPKTEPTGAKITAHFTAATGVNFGGYKL